MNVNINDTDKILVVAPHADDESIGCGGLLSLYGKQCDLLLVTDGRKGHVSNKYSDEELIKIRKQEFIEAANLAHVHKCFFLDIEDTKTLENKQTIYKFNIKDYDYIFVPNRYENQVDHSCLLKIFTKMKKIQHSKAKLFEYEVWTPMQSPTWYLDISSVIENKKKMIAVHKSQISDCDFVSHGIGLSSYRGMFNNKEYAEGFTDANFSGIKKFVYMKLPRNIRETIKNKLSRG